MYGVAVFASCSFWWLGLVFEQLNISSNSPPFGNYKLLSDFKSTAFICTNKEQNVMIHKLFFLHTFWVISRNPSLCPYGHQNILLNGTFYKNAHLNLKCIFRETIPLIFFFLTFILPTKLACFFIIQSTD